MSTIRSLGRIATRNGEPAYVKAPPRLRQSQVEKPALGPMEPEPKGLMAWIRK